MKNNKNIIDNLDQTNIEILDLLQKDARLSAKQIAHKLGKSLNSIYDRVRKLENSGIIKKYVAILDRDLIDKDLIAYTNVQLREHSHQSIKEFELAVKKFDQVMECNHMTGIYDYLLKVYVKDMNEYQDFVVNQLSKLNNIDHVRSSFVMTEIKNETRFVIA